MPKKNIGKEPDAMGEEHTFTEPDRPRRRRKDAGTVTASGIAPGQTAGQRPAAQTGAQTTQGLTGQRQAATGPVLRGNAVTRGSFGTGSQRAAVNPAGTGGQPVYPPQPWPYGQTPGAYGPQASGGYPPQASGGYPPQASGGYPPQASGGYPPQASGGYPPQTHGGFASQSQRATPYPPQQGAYAQTGSQGMKPRASSLGMPPVGADTGARRGYTPPPAPPTPATGRNVKVPDANRRRSNLKVLLWCVVVIAVLAGGYGAVRGIQTLLHHRQVSAAVSPYDARYCENVYVDGIHLGGMTQEEAKAAVTAQAELRAGNWSVRLTHKGESLREIHASDLGMSVHVDDALRAAWDQGHTGDQEQRLAAMQALEQMPFEAWTTTPGGDTSVIDAILNQISMGMYIAPQDASIAAFAPDRTYPFLFNEEVVGQVLNTAPIKEEIYHMVSEMESGEIELTPDVIEPTVTVASLQRDVVALRGTGSTPISTRSEENRNNNIRRAFELISGTVLHPGESFSFNGIVGQRTVGNGFFPADEYVYEQVQSGIGGGVCQASSTVYLAAVRAGLQIVHREPHSMAVNYTTYGKDATVYWYSNHKIDLVFKNNTESDIYITAAVQSAKNNKSRLDCNVNIYGAGLGDVTYDIVTIDTVIPPPEDERIRDKNAEYVTYTDEEYEVRKASDGHSVDSYRVTYDKKGNEIERKFLFTDLYKPKARQVMVGIKVREGTQ